MLCTNEQTNIYINHNNGVVGNNKITCPLHCHLQRAA